MSHSICVIDDDHIYRLIIKKVIEHSGLFGSEYYYTNAVDALEHLKIPGVVLPSLILLDINMPVMDGWQFLENLIEARPNLKDETKIFIVTSSIARSDMLKANSYKEVNGFVSKPVSVSKLKELASDFLKSDE